MSSLWSVCITILSLLFKQGFTQPAYVYDGTSVVNISGQYNWTLKYPLGQICEDFNWGKRLTIHLLKKSSQSDIVLAFGTQSEYFVFTISYDKRICVPLKYKPSRCRTILVTPPTGAPLQQSMISLEQQYARSDDFRDSLILIDIDSPNDTYHWTQQMTQWEVLVDEDTPGAWVENVSPLILDIRADRLKGETFLTIFKNGQNASITMGSTWDYNDDVYLYMGLDAIHDEIFELSGIESDDDCSWTHRPTTFAPTEPTLNPTSFPSLSPTESTSEPSDYPTDAPTPNTDNCNWQCYIDNYDDLKQSFGSDMNAAENHYKYSGYYENRNCQCIPTVNPTQSPITMNPTNSPSQYPSTAPSTEYPSKHPSVVQMSSPQPFQSTISSPELLSTIGMNDGDDDDDDIDPGAESDEDEGAAKVQNNSMIDGVDNFYLFIGIGAFIVMCLILIVVIVICRKFKGRTMRDPVPDDDDDW